MHIKTLLKSDKIFYGKLFSLTFPIALQSLMLAAVAAADAFMLGHVEQNSMSAVSLASQIQFVQNILISSVMSVVSILGAQYWGKQNKSALNDIFCISLKFSTGFSILFFAGCVFFPEYLMALFTNETVLIKIGCRYLKIAGWSYLLTGISQCYLAIMKVTERAKSAALISCCTVVLNIILNALLIFGGFGIPALGVEGAALATLISRAVELIWAVLFSFRKDFIHPQLRNFFKRNPCLEKDFVRQLLPLCGASLFWGIGFTSYTSFIGHKGEDAAAANAVVTVLRDLVYCLCNGLAAGAGITVGNELGKGDLEKGRLYGDRLVVISFITGFASTLIMILLTPLSLAVVKLTPEATSFLTGMMGIMAVYSIGRCVNTILINGIFSAGGDTLFDMYSLAVCMWGIAVPLAAAGTFLFNWNVLVVYACTCLDEVGKIPWVLHHYKKYRWVKDLTR